MEKISILGAGSWGTALGVVLGKKGYDVNIWGLDEKQVLQMNTNRENLRFLPGVVLPNTIYTSTNLEEVLHESKIIVISVPSHAIREVAEKAKPFIQKDSVIINTAKGIETATQKRLSQVLEDIFGEDAAIAVLSGPTHAEEVAVDMPTAIVVTSKRRVVAEKVQDIFMTPKFRVYTNPDIIGVEIGAALKNVIALACGICDGLGFGDNTKAAIMTRGIAEIARLGMELGANPLTFAGLTGIGDMVVTCTSMHSRNRRAGIQLGQGKPLREVLENMGMVVEGVKATEAAHYISQKYNVELPITEHLYKVLYEDLNPREAVVSLMTRLKTHEVEEVVINHPTW